MTRKVILVLGDGEGERGRERQDFSGVWGSCGNFSMIQSSTNGKGSVLCQRKNMRIQSCNAIRVRGLKD